MTTQSYKANLIVIRDQIASMRIVKCRMAHERFVGSTVPTIPSDDRSHNPFKRVGLCGSDERAERLGCSHSMSRVKLDEALSQLKSRRAVSLRSELNWLTNEIHLLDHRKGQAEASLATASGSCTKQKSMALEEVALLEQEHGAYVERLSVLRDKVLLEIDRII